MTAVLYYREGRALDHGPAVTRFQDFAEALAETDWIENHGTDKDREGYFHTGSAELAKLVQQYLDLDADGVVGPATWDAMFEALGRTPSGAEVYEVDGVTVIDGRQVWKPVKKWDGTLRPWTGDGRNVIRGVMLHQTGCWMPEDPQVWKQINAHCGVTRKGNVILMFPFEMLIWHGHNLTRPTIGIEIAGMFPGVKGQKGTYWPKDAKLHEFTDRQLMACNVLMEIIQGEFLANGGAFQNIYAHRQASSQRQADPGSEIWEKVALPWMEKIGATAGEPGYCIDSGYPICREWDPSAAKGFWQK